MGRENSGLAERIKHYKSKLRVWNHEIHKVIVGQPLLVDTIIKAIISNGHVLLEGPPGLAKTLVVKTLGNTVSDVKYVKIRFTPDYLPVDLKGITTYNPKEGFSVLKGPMFANFILADEVDCAPPIVQSAFFSFISGENAVIGKESFGLPEPYFVLAIQNPFSETGNYPLPLAYRDNFLFKVSVNYPASEDEQKIVESNTLVKKFEEFNVKRIMTPGDIFEMQGLVKGIYMSPELKKYIVNIVDATRNPENYGLKYQNYIEVGGSPRASIDLSMAGKATAFLHGRDYMIPEDVRDVVHNVLRHRIVLSYEGEAAQLSIDKIVDDIIKAVPVE
ncbi:MAG: MoxR family ATPase [archaeon]|nr:MoxR family ATPase [archaeon]